MKQPLHEGFPVAPSSRAKIRASAQHAREVLGLPPGRINIGRMLDDLTRFGIYYDVFDRAVDVTISRLRKKMGTETISIFV